MAQEKKAESREMFNDGRWMRVELMAQEDWNRRRAESLSVLCL